MTRCSAGVAESTALGDIDTALEALRAVQMLVDNAEELPCPLHLATLIGMVGDKIEQALRALDVIA